MSLIKSQDVSLGYENNLIVNSLNFEVNEGDYLCIVGENGSGKSTLMRTILNLQSPVSGHIDFGDGLTQNQIGYLPQQTVIQKDFPAYVEEIVLSGCLNQCGLRPFYTKNQKKLAAICMEKMDISDLKKKCYRNLSGGQQQRVLLARALCATNKMLLLDEPVSGLDPQATEKMYNLINELHVDGLTIIMISHDIESISKYATHILHIGSPCSYDEASVYFNKGSNKNE